MASSAHGSQCSVLNSRIFTGDRKTLAAKGSYKIGFVSSAERCCSLGFLGDNSELFTTDVEILGKLQSRLVFHGFESRC